MSNITKKIIILMPFGGDAEGLIRLYKLMLLRFKYIIEQRIGSIEFREKTFNFKADVFLTVTGDITSEALQLIRDTDIAIAYMNTTNVTVVYELAVRNLLRAETIVILDASADAFASRDESARFLPWYIRPYGHVVIGKEDSRIVEEIKALVADTAALGEFHSGTIPRSLKNLIDDGRDGKLETELKETLTKWLQSPPKRPPSILKIMADLDPEFMVSTSKSYYPSSVSKFTWVPKKEGEGYSEEDYLDSPVVCDWNPKYLALFGLEDRDPEDDGPLADVDIMPFLSKCVDPHDLAEFLEDQATLMQAIVFGSSTGAAQVPIRFNSKHPNPDYKNKSFLPCSILKKRIYPRTMVHNLYILQVYFPVTNSDNLVKNPDLIGPDSSARDKRPAKHEAAES